MRGTIGFERLTCSNKKYVRITLNDAVYRKSIKHISLHYLQLTMLSRAFVPEWSRKVLSFGQLCRARCSKGKVSGQFCANMWS